jgi:hypothetical protein
MPRTALWSLAVATLGAVAVVVLSRPSLAAPEAPYEMRFVSLTGEGSATKAWFEGAPPAGTRVQEALDRFAKEGFKYAALQPTHRPTNVAVGGGGGLATQVEPSFVLILERGR